MVAQNPLPFKLQATDDLLTPHAGLAVFGEFLKALDLPSLLDRMLPAPGSAVGYRPSRFVEPLVLMLHGGGRSLEDLRQIHHDAGLRALLRWEALPSTDATGDWLRRMGAGPGLEGLQAAQRRLLQRALKDDGISGYTLDLDATEIVAEKEQARWTYNHHRGYMPMVGHLAENGWIVGEEFREGNDSPNARNLEFIRHCAAQLPKGKRIAAVRADSASYQAAIFNWCEENDVKYAIGAVLDSAVRAAIAAIPAGDWRPYENGQIAETIHSMEGTTKAFRLIVIRRPTQGELFDATGQPTLRYVARASNRDESEEETLAWYDQRGESSENRIKELKIGFGMERLPCGDFGANAAFFRIGALAYNLFVLFKRMALPTAWRTCQAQTVRWRLYQLAGKIVRHGRQLALNVSAEALALLEAIRARNRGWAAAWRD